MVGIANVLYNFNLVLLWTKFRFNVLFKSPSISICKNFVTLECMLFSLLDMKCYSQGMWKCSRVVVYNFASYWFCSFKSHDYGCLMRDFSTECLYCLV
jgi:hypothetical protein